MTNTALDSAATRLLFHLRCASAANIVHKRRTKDAGDSVFRNEATQFMGRDPQQREIKQAEPSRQTIPLHRSARERRYARHVKRQQRGILGKQLFVALFLFRCPLAVLLD